MIDIIKREAGKYKRYVIECGINDAGLTPDMANQFLSALKGDGIQIYFVNQRVIGGADDITCKTVKDTANANDGVYEIDWNSMASGHESEWFTDICHPNQTGAEKLTTLIHDELTKHATDNNPNNNEEDNEESNEKETPVNVEVTQA